MTDSVAKEPVPVSGRESEKSKAGKQDAGTAAKGKPASAKAENLEKADAERIAKLSQGLNWFHFVLYVLRRFGKDRGTRVAASLSYSSLLAIVPMLTIMLALLMAFPGFENARSDLQGAILANLLPSAELQIAEQLDSFIANANQMTSIGVVALAVTAIMLLYTISNSFNAIWRVQERRPLFNLILVYWALITLGPLMLGTSLSVSSYGFAVAAQLDESGYTKALLTGVLPFILSATAFTILYMVVPNRPVFFRHALAGGIVATILFELLKRGFGYYLLHFPSYQAIYGALATIPIFLVWMYLSWVVVLIGAEITAALPERRAAARRGVTREGVGDRLSLSLSLLRKLYQAGRKGIAMRETSMVKGLPADLQASGEALMDLKRMQIAEKTAKGQWVLCRDLSTVTLEELLQGLGLDYTAKRNWPEGIDQVIERLSNNPEETRQLSLQEVVEATDGEQG